MSPLVEQALRDLNSDDLDIVNDGFLILGEIVSVNRFGGFYSDIVPEANHEILEWGPLEEIQRAVQSWVESHSDHPSVVSAFYVLMKFGDKALRPFFRRWLDAYVQRILPNARPLGQILIALDLLGERATSSGSYSALNYGENINRAIAYLESKKKKAK